MEGRGTVASLSRECGHFVYEPICGFIYVYHIIISIVHLYLVREFLWILSMLNCKKKC